MGRSEETEQSTDTESVELERSSHPVDLASQLGDDRFQPPGELVAFTTSISKLTVLAVKKTNPWSVFWMVLVAVVGGIGALSLLLLTGVPAQPDCAKVSIISTDSERLHCAKLATANATDSEERAKLVEAIDLVEDWSSLPPLVNDGKTQLDLWSRQLIRVSSRELAVDGDINRAVEGLKKIPPTSAVYADAQSMTEKWQQQWLKGAENTKAFQEALQAAKWFNASLYLSRVGLLQSKYWSRTQYDKMSAQLTWEQEGWERYREAESLALSGDLAEYKSGSFHRLGDGKRPREKVQAADYTDNVAALAKAIYIGSKVNKDTYVYAKIQERQKIWSQRIADISAKKY
jgi:hypothetical protein